MRGGPFVLEALHAGLRARGPRLERDAIRAGTVRWRPGTGPAPDAGREVHAGTVAAALEARGWGRAIAREYASGTLPREGVSFRIQLASGPARRERRLTWVRAHWRNRGRGLLGEILTPTA